MSGIFDVGAGIIILIVVWSVAIGVAFVSFRTRKNLGSVVLVLATLFTSILLVIPLETKTPSPKAHKVCSRIINTKGRGRWIGRSC